MADDPKIDIARFLTFARQTENPEVSHQMLPERHTRPQDEKERVVDYFQKQSERDGSSGWSGASAGGGTWAGRSR